MKNFTVKYIRRGSNAFSLAVNFTRCVSDNKDITATAKETLKQQVINPDDYKLLSIIEK